jgi:hypothetical protein
LFKRDESKIIDCYKKTSEYALLVKDRPLENLDNKSSNEIYVIIRQFLKK